MNISDYRLLQSHFNQIPAIRPVRAPRVRWQDPQNPPEYPTPIEIPDPTEIPPPVPGDAPQELPGGEENPAPEIEPPKEQMTDDRRARDTATFTLTIRIQQIRSRRTTLIRFMRTQEH